MPSHAAYYMLSQSSSPFVVVGHPALQFVMLGLLLVVSAAGFRGARSRSSEST